MIEVGTGASTLGSRGSTGGAPRQRSIELRLAVTLMLCLSPAGGMAGCYVYAPTGIGDVPIGAEVRIALAAEARLDAELGGLLSREAVVGKLLGADGERVLLLVEASAAGRTFGSQVPHRELALSARDVIQIDVKRLHVLRTATAFAALGAGLSIIMMSSTAEQPIGYGPPSSSPDESIRRGLSAVVSRRRP